MLPLVYQNIPANKPEIQNFPKSIAFNGKSVRLLSGDNCFQTFGCYPGAVLNSEEGCFIVMGMGRKGELWVKTPLGGKNFPLENVHSQNDLTLNGYEIINKKKRKAEEANIDDSQDVVARVHKLFKVQSKCDISFEIEGQIVGAHAAILIEGSDYFRSLLDGSFKEGSSTVIKLEECTREEFDILMDYLYSGRININKENVLWIAGIADFFAAEKLKQHCESILTEFLTPATTLSYLEAIAGKDHCFVSLILKAFYLHFKDIMLQDSDTIDELDEQTLYFIIQYWPSELKEAMIDFILLWLLPKDNEFIARANLLDEIFLLCNEDYNLLQKYSMRVCQLLREIPSIQTEFEILVQTSQSKTIKIIYAIILSQFQKPQEAKIFFENLLEHEPDNLFAQSHLADALNKLTQYAAAKLKCEAIFGLMPNNIFILKIYGDVLRNMNQLAEAKAVFEKALSLDPKDPSALRSYAETLRNLGQFNLAKTKFEEALTVEPENTFALTGYGNTLCQLRLFDQAKAPFETAFAFEPNNYFVLRGYAEILRMMNQLDAAKNKFEEALALQPLGITGLASYADTLRMLEDFDAAHARFQEAYALNPNNLLILNGYADTLLNLGQYSAAKEKFEKALQLEPKNPIILRGYGEALRHLGLLDAAKVKIKEALILSPSNGLVQTSYGETLRDLGELESAERQLKYVLTMSPGNVTALAGYAETLRLMGDFYEAKNIFEKALSIKPNNPFALRGYADTLCKIGIFDLANSKFEEALVLEPDHPFAVRGYADTFFQQGKWDEAKMKYEEILAHDPNNLDVLTNFHETLRQIQKKREVNDLKTINEIFSENNDAFLQFLEDGNEISESNARLSWFNDEENFDSDKNNLFFK